MSDRPKDFASVEDYQKRLEEFASLRRNPPPSSTPRVLKVPILKTYGTSLNVISYGQSNYLPSATPSPKPPKPEAAG